MPWNLYMCHSSHFDAFFPVKINKMWKFCLILWFFRNHLLYRLKTCTIGFSMPQTLNMHYSSHFDAFFLSQNQQNVKSLAVCLTPPDKKWKNINLNREKVFEKAWKSADTGFWVYRLQCTILDLCVTSTFWVMMVFLDFWQEGLGIGFWNMV